PSPAEEEEAAAPKGRVKRSLRSTSKLFLGFKKLGLRRPKKGQFKNTSRFFWGLQKQSTKRRRKKKKNKAVLKSTSNLMVRFKRVGKKRKEAAGSAPPAKPSFLLLRRGGQVAEDGASLFRRRPERKFKPRAQVLSKAAAATGWLARKVLSRRGRLAGGGRAADTAWLSRIGARKLPFPAEDEILRHRANMKRIPGGSGLSAPSAARHGQERHGSTVQHPSQRRSQRAPVEPPVPRYGWAKEEDGAYGHRRGYAKEEDGAYSSQHGYTKEDGAYGPWRGYTEGEEGYIQTPAYPAGYGFEDAVPTPYADYPGYEVEEEYGFYGGFWEEGDPPGHPYGYTELEDEGPFSCGSPLTLYDPYGNDLEYGEEPAGPFGYGGDFGEPLSGGYPGGEYPEHCIQYSEGGWAPHAQSSCNPYALALEEIAEAEEPEEWEEEEEEDREYPFSILSASSLRDMRETLSSKLSLNRKFRLFPRPQIKLFGRDRLDDDYDEYEPPPLAAPGPTASPGHRVSAARACGSPLGQFLQRSLSQPPGRPPRGAGGFRNPRTPQPSYRRSGHRLVGMESADSGGWDPPPRASLARNPSPPVGPWGQPPPREPGAARRSSLRNPFANPGRFPSPLAQQRPGSVRGEGPRRSPSLAASLRGFSPKPPAPPPAAPCSPGPVGRHLGVPVAGSGRPLSPRPSRRSSPPGLPLPQAWPQLPEPPTKAVKPLQRTPFLALTPRPGSRRLGPPCPSWDEELPPWQGAARDLAGVPPPSSPAPSTPKTFIQRIGQPLAGMAPRSPPARLPPAEVGARSSSPGRSVGQSLASLLVGSMAPAEAPPSPPPARRPSSRSPSLPRRPSRRDRSTRRSPSPPAGRRGWADAGHPILPSSPPSDWSPSPQRRAAFPAPRGRAPGSPAAPRRGTRALGPVEAVEGDGAAGEEGTGRYAVVTPQVQRLGSFRRASRMYKQHWSTQHVVRVREMPDAWTAEQGPPRQPTQRGRLLRATRPASPLRVAVGHGRGEQPPAPRLGPHHSPLPSSPLEVPPCPGVSITHPLQPPWGGWVNHGVLRWGWHSRLRLFLPAHGERDPGSPGIAFPGMVPKDALVAPCPHFQHRCSPLTCDTLAGGPVSGPWGACLGSLPSLAAGSLVWGHRWWLWGSGRDLVGRRRVPTWPCRDGAGLDCSTQMQSLCSLPIVRYQEPQEEDGLEDMTQLEDLQEAAVLSNIRTRFERQLIYTYIGSILVSVNPYQLYNIYGTEQVLQYEGRALGENPPHLFAIANVAYSKVMDAKHNQCIIISGESGSGKTEATKLILRYLAAVSQKRSTAPQILEATPLLESFGNAKTVRNDNSSRFGKFVEIFLEDGLICGAITSQYLLEKSRVVFQVGGEGVPGSAPPPLPPPQPGSSAPQAKTERNYHIFYEMLAGLPAQQRQRYCLQGAETYYYLNQGGNCEIPGKDDAEDFRRLLNIMEALGFSVEEQNSIFRILSSVLHLGNVYFEKYEAGRGVPSPWGPRLVLLKLHHAVGFVRPNQETLREKIFTPLTVESAVDARDAIAKTLYSLLFSWLTDRINKLVYPRQEALSIAILDIYGFEDLNFNSFEQLCINYANEYLQSFFNKIVFQEEQEEYLREQIEWKEIPFSDNQPCIDLISQKPYGILRILDDQSCFPQATDHTFLQKCHYHHGTNPLYTKPKMPLPEFTIKHYAGKVTYQVHKFLDKIYDQVRQDVLDLFISSRTKVVANLFFGHAQVMARQRSLVRRSSTRTRRYKAPTVAARFQQSLLDLVEKMERCNPFFVRCLKPNNKKEPGLFEADVVSSQLRYSGILETIRIRKEGFPIRIPFLVFIDRYRCLVDMWSNVIPNGANCVEMLRNLCSVSPSMYYIGVSKLFLKEQLYQALESKRARAHHLAALTLQRYARTFFIKRRFRSLRRKIVLLQSRARGYLARQRYRRMRHTLIKFRSLVHIYVNRRRYLKVRQGLAHPRGSSVVSGCIPVLRLQELTRREVVDVTHLEIPAELMGLLEAAAAAREVNAGCVVLVPPPALQPDSQLTLPLDINDYPMAKYVRGHFQEPAFGMLTAPLAAPLTRLDEELCHEALSLFQLILRFMGDPGLGGPQETLFGNYIVQKGLSVPGLRDELLAQAANQVWRNTNVNNEERGWLLLAACLSAFPPSATFDKYLLKFVSDYAFAGYKPVCQRKLMHAMARSQLGTAAARAYPPSLLEWTANRQQASMALDLHCFNGDQFSCPVHSWSTGEDLAGDVLKHRGLAEGWRGWSVAMKAGAQWAELAGHDYVLDLVSDLELLRGFPKQKSCFLIAWEGAKSCGRDSQVVLGHGLDLDEVPPPPAVKAPTLPSTEAYPPHGRASSPLAPRRCWQGRANGDFGEPRSQKGLDRYLDSLFDPVLSYGNGELEKPAAVSQRMKGGGGAGGGDGGGDAEQSRPPPPGPPVSGAGPGGLGGVEPCPASTVGQLSRVAPRGWGQLGGAKSSRHGVPCRAKQRRGRQPTPPSPGPTCRKLVRGPSATGWQWGLVAPSQAPGVRVMPGPPPPSHVLGPAAPVGQRWPGELVQHSRLNSEHFPRPTHDIRNIIRQCQPAPRSSQPPSKLFGKKLDPHEEAMQILKEQLSAARLAPVPQFPRVERGSWWSPPGTCRAFRPFAVSVSRELPSEAQQVQTQLHRSCSEDFYTYHNVPWKIYIRKEVFYPKDSINNPLLLDLIFRQIFNDTFSDTCIRIGQEERLRLKSLFAENKLDSFSPVATESVKREIVTAARDGCEVYFSRLFPATGSVGTGVQILAVSHAGVKLLRLVKGTNVPGEQLRVLRAYSYADVLFVTTPSRNMLEFNLHSEKLILFSPKAPQVKAMVDHFITELRKDSQYVVAVRNYSPEDGGQLSFHKGDIIHLQPLERPERDHYYGCVVRKKVIYLEELKTGTQDFGWKFGAIHGRSGLFPAEYVQPITAPDFVHLPAERKEEPRDKQGKVAALAAVAMAVASTAVAQELDQKTEVVPGGGTGTPHGGDTHAHLLPRPSPRDSCRMKVKRDVPDVLEMLTFTKTPIQESLIEFMDGGISRLATEAFQAVMKFMGDHPLRGQTELDAICTILKLCAEHEVLRDEVYCQIIKQVTNNTSSKPESCQKGWRLLYILAAYYKCSEVLRPFLLAFLKDASRHPELPFQGIAKACEQNLRKTLQFGGRSLFPSSMELRAMVAGRSAKRQLFLLPGGIERHLKIKTCSVALDVIEELCCEMGLQHPEAFDEYILFVVTDGGQSVRPLTRREYVLDVAAEVERRDAGYTFWCRRVVWSQPLKFDNELYVTVHYNQVLPDYLKGLFTVLPPARPGEQHFPHMAKLAALQHRAKDSHHLPTAREVQDYVPPQLFRLLKAQSWLHMVTQHMQQAQALSAHQARAQFLGLLSAYPMFGSSFFYIQSCSNNAIVSPCILAVNQNGLNFLSKETHEPVAKFSLKEIQSTRTQRPTAGSSYPYVEITLGDLLARGITQLQLEQ
ncbi:Unconventional myosin-XV, partial [Spheniscus humboldti]